MIEPTFRGHGFTASYRGQCEDCYEPIEPGQQITYGSGGYVHISCPDDPDLTASTQPVCPRCTARHAGEC